jgi:hypothetical protein
VKRTARPIAAGRSSDERETSRVDGTVVTASTVAPVPCDVYLAAHFVVAVLPYSSHSEPFVTDRPQHSIWGQTKETDGASSNEWFAGHTITRRSTGRHPPSRRSRQFKKSRLLEVVTVEWEPATREADHVPGHATDDDPHALDNDPKREAEDPQKPASRARNQGHRLSGAG